ncbi:MAG: GTP-binding protein, partial [Pseudomonadota bacterium]
GESLADVAQLDSMVTVVDAASLLKDYASSDFLRDRGETMGDEDDRTLVDLLVDQIEFADTIILNKVSAASPGDLDAARKIIRALNPDAVLTETDFSQVPMNNVLGTGRFDFEKAHEHPLWYKELNGFADHIPETEEYGIRSFVYRAKHPFDPMKLQGFINKPWPGVVRAKGFFWLATRPRYVGELSMAGALVKTEKRGLWWSAAPKEYWPEDPAWHKAMEPYFDPVWGDRRQELVFIGCDPMDEQVIRKGLDACLIKAPAFIPDLWTKLPDPFPSWEKTAA